MAVFVRPLDQMPRISVDGVELTSAQAEAVRVAITNFYSEVSERGAERRLGPIAGAYRDRLREVLKILFKLDNT